jgi:hypothetical protein
MPKSHTRCHSERPAPSPGGGTFLFSTQMKAGFSLRFGMTTVFLFFSRAVKVESNSALQAAEKYPKTARDVIPNAWRLRRAEEPAFFSARR